MNDKNLLDDLLKRKIKSPFVLNFSEFSNEENNYWTERLNENYFSCGCKTGEKYLIFGILFFTILILYFAIFTSANFRIIYIPIILFALFMMAGIGKLIGKLKAEKKLVKGIIVLKKKLNYVDN